MNCHCHHCNPFGLGCLFELCPCHSGQGSQQEQPNTTGESASQLHLLSDIAGSLKRIADSLSLLTDKIPLLERATGILRGPPTQCQDKIESQNQESDHTVTAKKKAKAEKKGRSILSLTFCEDTAEWRAKWGIPEDHPSVVIFTNYWLSEGRRKADWKRTWDMWLIRESSYNRGGSHNRPGFRHGKPKPAWLQAIKVINASEMQDDEPSE